MTIEGGSRRIATLLSLTALSSGVLFTVLLAAASAWSLHLERQERARLEAEGCPLTPEDERRAVLPAVEVAEPNRWRVILGERPPTAGRWPYRAGAYVIIAGRQLTEVEVLEAARASDRDRGSTDLARWHPSPGVEVIDCVMESVEISRARYATAVSSPLIDCWTAQGAGLYLRSWMNVVPLARWVFVAGTLISALMLTAIAAGLPWGVFYLVRWIARGFTSMEQKKSAFGTAMKYAIITALASFIFSIITYLTGFHLNQAASWLVYVIPLAGLVFTVKDRRDKELGGYMTFGGGFSRHFCFASCSVCSAQSLHLS
jgi:hypothetical protein